MIDGNTEIRKLTPRIILALAQILDPNYQWEILMSLIQEPDETSEGGYVDKYSMQDISLIREAGSKSGLSCTAIFLEEWGTSGRNRPTVRTLLELLVKAEMFRAADYIAVDVLKEAPPRRPDHWMDNEIFLTDTTSGQVTECFPSVCNENTVRCEELDKIRDDLMLRNDTNNGDLDQPNEKINYVNYETIKKITCNFNPTLKLGNGAFGSVYLGKLNDKKVAIKVLSIYEDYSNLLGHFKNELVILYERSEHPNVLPLLGASCDAVPCLIYEYMPNGSLEKRLACELKEFPPLTWQKRVSIANDVTEGLKYLHTLSIIHRDIKAANVLLDCNDVARIGDFGLVRKSGGMKTSSTALLQGTSVYMAPEALRGFISPKMDIFSFGVLLLELLTGLPGEREDGIGLYDYLQDVINKDEDFIAWLDEKAGIWETKIWTTMYTLFKNCTQHEKRLRPDISEVNSVMSSLREIV